MKNQSSLWKAANQNPVMKKSSPREGEDKVWPLKPSNLVDKTLKLLCLYKLLIFHFSLDLGFWNSNFTEYRVEETPQKTENSVATVDVITETQDSSRTVCNKLDGACVKETEL